MSDMIFYKNGEETFRISPPTVGTKCPETKLEVKKMTEIEKTKKDIEVLTAKLALLEEIENHKTPCEEAFKRVYNRYPVTDVNDTCWDGSTWIDFKFGYIASQEDYNDITLSYQDDGRTLKVFVNKVEPKSPAEEAYKRVYGAYPMGEPFWIVFKKGYEEAQEDYKVGEYRPTSQEPEELKTLHQMMYDEEWCKSGCDEFCDIVKRWLSQYEIDGWEDDWEGGFSDCLDKLNKGLK